MLCRGFSLVEISLLLLIFGGIAAMGITLGGAWIDSERIQSTRLKLQTIEEAIDAYRNMNGRLPCPADITLTADVLEYGFEAYEMGDTLGQCAGEGSINAQAAGAGVVYGAVPTETLEINEALMRDQWGNLFVYYVTERATQEGSFWDSPRHANYLSMGSTQGGRITIQDGRGGNRTTRALYALVSHGSNEYGGYDRGGNRRPTTDATAGELENTDNTPNAVLVAKTLDEDFDDLIQFKERRHLANPIIGCEDPWGNRLEHGQQIEAYETNTVPCDALCNKETRTCLDGELSGSFDQATCSAEICLNCTAPWGATISHGVSVFAYQASSVPCGSMCVSETRTCNNGSFSGGYTRGSCSAAVCRTCRTPWGATIAHGSSATGYRQYRHRCDRLCSSQSAICNDGFLNLGGHNSRSCSPRICRNCRRHCEMGGDSGDSSCGRWSYRCE